MIQEFKNEPIMDINIEANRRAMLEAIANVEGRPAPHVPLLIGGREIRTADEFPSLNPSDPSQIVGWASTATAEHADQAVQAAAAAFPAWSRTSFDSRARILLRAASIMRRRRCELNAVEILEAGKPWLEADGDVAEAIDFLEFYAREAFRYGGIQPVTILPGEDDAVSYIPTGVTVGSTARTGSTSTV